ncbi:hypothetical protein [Porticoccus sp.]|uniref:hypothetical protein n=1 Tax=Porticoccus sp. TaxID=2024853 RepID=UPI003F6A2118
MVRKALLKRGFLFLMGGLFCAFDRFAEAGEGGKMWYYSRLFVFIGKTHALSFL